MTRTSSSIPWHGVRGRMRLGVFLICILPAMLGVRWQIRKERQQIPNPNPALAEVLTTEERMAAALLGGFRSILINVLWIRILWRIEHQRFLELPLYYEALEAVQGPSPFLSELQARQMVLDVPRELPHREDERWRWILRGFEVLREGRERFPRHVGLLSASGFLYYIRFHRAYNPKDLERFLAEQKKDPLDLAAHFLEAARNLPDQEHSFEVDMNLCAIYRQQIIEHLETESGPRQGPELIPAARVLAKWRNLLDHFEETHLAGSSGIRRRILSGFLLKWREQLSFFEAHVKSLQALGEKWRNSNLETLRGSGKIDVEVEKHSAERSWSVVSVCLCQPRLGMGGGIERKEPSRLQDE